MGRTRRNFLSSVGGAAVGIGVYKHLQNNGASKQVKIKQDKTTASHNINHIEFEGIGLPAKTTLTFGIDGDSPYIGIQNDGDSRITASGYVEFVKGGDDIVARGNFEMSLDPAETKFAQYEPENELTEQHYRLVFACQEYNRDN